MTKIRMVPAILFAVAISCSFASHAQTATPQQVLQQYVADLQKSPDDTALREKIINHVRSMKRAPAIPEEARRHFIEGNALLKAAKDQRGYELAIEAYRKSLLIAPWWPDANYNFAVALELADRFDSSVNALKLYIATNPGEEETRKAQDKIYEIGAKKIIAAREREESPPQVVAAREQNKFEEWLKSLDGRRYTYTNEYGDTAYIDIRGNIFVDGWIGKPETGSNEIKGRETTIQLYNHPWKVSVTFIISEDGNSITTRDRLSNGRTVDFQYHRQR